VVMIQLMHMLNKFKDFGKSAFSRAKKAAGSDDQYIVGLDIGTEFVKALIGKVVDDKIEIIGAGREHQDLSDMQSGAIADIGSVVQNCDEALRQAEQQAGISARSVVIGIAGELVKGITTTVRCSRKNPSKPLDITEMERIIKLVQDRALIKAKKQLAWETGGKSIELRLVNSALVNIDIDGYTVTNPIGFQGKDVLVQLYTAFAPMIHLGALEKTAEELELDLLAVAAEPFAVARSVIGDNPNANMSAILMDVGGGTTDIAVVNEGGVQGTKSFGIGGRAYTRSVERDLNVEFLQAEQLKIGLTDGVTPQSKIAAVEKSLEKTANVWIKGVELALGEFNKLDHLPHRVLLCGGGSSLDVLIDKIEATDWYNDLPFTRKPVIQHLEPDQVVGIVDKTGQVNDHTYITAMGLLRIGLDTQQYAGGDGDTIREKIDRILQV